MKTRVAELVALVLENALMVEVLSKERPRLETLLSVSPALVSSLNVHKLFQQVSASIGREVRQGFTHLALYDENADAMRTYVLDAVNNRDFVPPETLVPVSEYPPGIAFALGEQKVFSSADLESINSTVTGNLLAHGVRTVCCFPLVSRGRKLGTLSLSSLTENAFPLNDLDLLAQIASQLAIAVDNARAYDEIAKLKERLAKERLFILLTLRESGGVSADAHAAARLGMKRTTLQPHATTRNHPRRVRGLKVQASRFHPHAQEA